MIKAETIRGATVAALLAAAASATPAETTVKSPQAIAGEELFARHCQACHGIGPDKPGTVALTIRNEGRAPAELARRTDLSPEMIKMVVRWGMMNMPPFRKTEISDAELERLSGWLARPRSSSRKTR